MKSFIYCRIVTYAAVCLTGITSVNANVKLAAPFSDHMALQYNAAVPIWGTNQARCSKIWLGATIRQQVYTTKRTCPLLLSEQMTGINS